MNLSVRFLSKTKQVGDCLEWQAGMSTVGYGKFWLDGKNIGAHRAAWKIFKGEIPAGMHILHRCDNRSCVNPEHLFLGTNQDNVDDKVKKGRSLRGERNWRAKLRDDEVRSIRVLFRSYGWAVERIAKHFHVRRGIIYYTLSDKGWKHLNET